MSLRADPSEHEPAFGVFSPQRARIYEVIRGSREPLSAYDILDRLRGDGVNAPTTVYRALDYLMKRGLVHRVERLNAYVACTEPEHPHSGQFVICESCGQVLETQDERIAELVKQLTQELGFALKHQTVEAVGVCSGCRAEKG